MAIYNELSASFGGSEVLHIKLLVCRAFVSCLLRTVKLSLIPSSLNRKTLVAMCAQYVGEESIP